MHKSGKSYSRFWAALAATIVVSLGSLGALALSGNADGQDVISFLGQTIAWHRHLASEQQIATDAGDLNYLNNNRQVGDQVVRLAFEFAKARAQLLAKSAPSAPQPAAGQERPGASRYQNLLQRVAKLDQSIQERKQELQALEQKLKTASGRARATLESAMAQTQSEIELAQARKLAMRSLLDFIGGTGASGDLRSQIDELERAVPAAMLSTKPAPEVKRQEADDPLGVMGLGRKEEPTGLLALATDLFRLRRKMRTLDETVRLSEQLGQASRELRTPLMATMREMTRRGDELGSQPQAGTPDALAKQKAEIDALTAEFKQLSAAVLPLGKVSILLDVQKQNSGNWRDSVRTLYLAELKSLLVRLAVLAVVIAIVVVLSKLWSRAIFRYVRDARRQHQLLFLRRVVLWFVIATIVLLAFATELGSLATFAGLLTAGIAFALQNVILSVVAYFFLIGKYGVRVGDRVQISGVTGDVVDIGLVRLHLMEVADDGAGPRPTGRVVVFSNSVVLQPNAGFFKQIPGTSFVWHEISLTFAADSDYRLVEERLLGAAQSVFAQFRENIEHQRKAIERALVPLSVRSLNPQSRVRLTQAGLEVLIRFPVALDNAAEIDDRMTRGLLDAIERDPRLKVIGSAIPGVQLVTAQAPPESKAAQSAG